MLLFRLKIGVNFSNIWYFTIMRKLIRVITGGLEIAEIVQWFFLLFLKSSDGISFFFVCLQYSAKYVLILVFKKDFQTHALHIYKLFFCLMCYKFKISEKKFFCI